MDMLFIEKSISFSHMGKQHQIDSQNGIMKVNNE